MGAYDEEQEAEPIRRLPPQSDLDLNLMMTDPEWGRDSVNPEFKRMLGAMWVEKNMFTRDIRLSNLDAGELRDVRHYLNLTADLLQCGFFKAAGITMGRAATVLESSQGKKGFLRKEMNTITQQRITRDEAPKKRLFGGNKEAQ
jgi:hypothetical protein